MGIKRGDAPRQPLTPWGRERAYGSVRLFERAVKTVKLLARLQLRATPEETGPFVRRRAESNDGFGPDVSQGSKKQLNGVMDAEEPWSYRLLFLTGFHPRIVSYPYLPSGSVGDLPMKTASYCLIVMVRFSCFTVEDPWVVAIT
jgi:hypothetical protein